MSGGAKHCLARRASLVFIGVRLVENGQDGSFGLHAQGKISGDGDIDDAAGDHFGLQNMPFNNAISTVAPNIATACCTPITSVCPADKRSSGATTPDSAAGEVSFQRGKSKSAMMISRVKG